MPVPPYQDDQGRTSHELEEELTPNEINPEYKSDTHEQPAQEVAQGDEQHDPLAMVAVEVSSIQEGSVPSSESLVIPLADVPCEEDEKTNG